MVPARRSAKSTAGTNPSDKSGNKSAHDEVGAAVVVPASRTPGSTRSTTRRSSSSPSARKAATTKKASAVAKKATTGVISPESLKVKDGEDPWTQEELDEVVAELNEARDHALAVLTAQEAELSGLMRDSGDGAGQDQADMGATSFERDHELTVVNSERDKLAQIERAFAYLADGTYGICESCGEPIGKMRLMAFPRATLCMRCKQREERR